MPVKRFKNVSIPNIARSNIGWAFVLVLFISCSFISVITPPFQSPDEYDHIKRAYLLSKGTIVLDAPTSEPESGGMVDIGLLTYMKIHTRYSYEKNTKLSLEENQIASGIEWSGSEQFSPAPGTGYYFPLIYSPQAIGLAVGEFFDLTVDHSYRLARFFTLLAISLALLWAFHLYTPSALVLALIVLPMSLFQLSTASLDGISSAITILAISAFLRITNDKESSPSWLVMLLATCVFLLASSRVHLLPMVLLVFAAYFYTRDRISLVLGALVTTLVLAWTAVAISSTVDARVSLGASTSELLRYYVFNPLQFIQVLWNTVTDAAMTSHWRQSFFGVLGWLDTWFSPVVYGWLGVLLLLTLFFSVSFKDIRHNWPARALLLVCSASSLLIMLLALLVTWTPHPASIIDGVQGRYFLLPALLLAYSLFFNVNAGSASHAGNALQAGAVGRVETCASWLRLCGLASLAALFGYSALNTTNRLMERYYIHESTAYWSTAGNTTIHNHIFGELSDGRVFEQTFLAESNNVLLLRLFMATFSRQNSGSILVEIVDPGNKVIVSQKINAATVKDNEWLTISTGGVPLNKHRNYKLRLTAPGVASGQAITWWASGAEANGADAYPQGHAIVDSVAQASDFAFEIFSFPSGD